MREENRPHYSHVHLIACWLPCVLGVPFPYFCSLRGHCTLCSWATGFSSKDLVTIKHYGDPKERQWEHLAIMLFMKTQSNLKQVRIWFMQQSNIIDCTKHETQACVVVSVHIVKSLTTNVCNLQLNYFKLACCTLLHLFNNIFFKSMLLGGMAMLSWKATHPRMHSQDWLDLISLKQTTNKQKTDSTNLGGQESRHKQKVNVFR